MATVSKKQTGDRGEALVIAWLQQEGWQIVAQQWRCRWGELDIVAFRPQIPSCLAFVEVKTRCQRNWDEAGRLAVTPQKQQKLWLSAEHFLSQYPQWGELPCRFDVALVMRGRSRPTDLIHQCFEGETYSLVEYLENAFQG